LFNFITLQFIYIQVASFADLFRKHTTIGNVLSGIEILRALTNSVNLSKPGFIYQNSIRPSCFHHAVSSQFIANTMIDTIVTAAIS